MISILNGSRNEKLQAVGTCHAKRLNLDYHYQSHQRGLIYKNNMIFYKKELAIILAEVMIIIISRLHDVEVLLE